MRIKCLHVRLSQQITDLLQSYQQHYKCNNWKPVSLTKNIKTVKLTGWLGNYLLL